MAEVSDGRGSVSQPELGAGERLRQLINGYQVTQAIEAFVTLGLPQRLAAGPRPLAELAADAAAILVRECASAMREENEVFNHAMHALSSATAARLADRYDFSRFSTVADLGGGDGTLLAAVLASHPHLEACWWTCPTSSPRRRSGSGGRGGDRCRIIAGSFFDDVPAGCDAYVLKSILHDGTTRAGSAS